MSPTVPITAQILPELTLLKSHLTLKARVFSASTLEIAGIVTQKLRETEAAHITLTHRPFVSELSIVIAKARMHIA